jgi:hypothetical protein
MTFIGGHSMSILLLGCITFSITLASWFAASTAQAGRARYEERTLAGALSAH